VASDIAMMHTMAFFLGEWDHFLYVGKITLFGWALHYCEHFVPPQPGEADAVLVIANKSPS